jgi:hypothetical protein
MTQQTRDRARLRPRHGIAMLVLGSVALAVGLLQTTSSTASDPGASCPPGTSLVARFQYNDGQYQWIAPDGSEGLVTITGGTSTDGSWDSQVPVAAVVVQGATGSVVTTYSPAQLSGTFSSAALPPFDDDQATPSFIVKVSFCAPDEQPTTTTAEPTTTTVFEDTTTTTIVEETTTTVVEETTTTVVEETTTTVELPTSTRVEDRTSSTPAPTTTTTADPTTTTTAAPTTTTAAPTTTTGGVTTTVPGSQEQLGASSSTSVVTAAPSSASGTLAFTGGPSPVLVSLGVGLIGAGGALTLVTRRRDTAR